MNRKEKQGGDKKNENFNALKVSDKNYIFIFAYHLKP